jgi:hypothetical protein
MTDGLQLRLPFFLSFPKGICFCLALVDAVEILSSPLIAKPRVNPAH